MIRVGFKVLGSRVLRYSLQGTLKFEDFLGLGRGSESSGIGT